MRPVHVMFLILVCAGVTCAQAVTFDCQAVGGFPPIGGAGDCEGVTSNGSTTGFNVGTGVTAVAGCGLPTSGTQFARIVANGPIGMSHAASTPIPRPAPANISEIRVPVPAGATSLALCYNFYNAEAAFGVPTAQYNDGVEIAIVDATGASVLVPVIYVDTFNGLTPSGCIYAGNPESGGAGIDTTTVSFPGGVAAGAYVSIACWNSFDNAFTSHTAIDSITFNPSGCSVCPSSSMGLVFGSPFGAGSLQIDITSNLPSGAYFLAITFNQGAFPLGWLYGVDIAMPELFSLANLGFPFFGGLDSCGNFSIGPFTGLGFLSGVPFYAVTLGFPSGGGLVPTKHSAAVTASVQ